MSVLIPTLDDEEELKGLLRSLGGQGIGEILRKEGGDPIEADNELAKAAHGDIILFTAADVRMEPDTIARIHSGFMEPRTIAIAGHPIPDGITLRLGYEFYLAMMWLFGGFPSTGNLLAIRRDAFMRLGGFEKTYNNDGQMGRKLRRIGKVRYDRGLTYRVSSRRYRRHGLIGFALQHLYMVENLLPVSGERWRRPR